jgi:glucose-6-phosphate-specific signal transduction histidine kinase
VALLIKLFLDHYKPQLNKNYLQSIKTIQISIFLSKISRAIPSKRKLRDSSSIMPSMMKKIYLPVSQRNSHLPKRELDMDPLSKALQHLYSDLQPEKAPNKEMQRIRLMMRMMAEHQISLMKFRNLSRRHQNRHLMLRRRCLR